MNRDDVLSYFTELEVWKDVNLSIARQKSIIRRVFKNVLEDYLDEHSVLEIWETLRTVMCHELYSYWNTYELVQLRNEFEKILNDFNRNINELDVKTAFYICKSYASTGEKRERLASFIHEVNVRFEHVNQMLKYFYVISIAEIYNNFKEVMYKVD